MAKKKRRKLNSREIARQERIKKVERMMLRGIKNQTHIAAAFGVSHVMIKRDMDEIRKNWKGRDPDEAEARVTERIVQLEGILQLALNAFDKSSKNETEQSISRKLCDRCGGNEVIQVSPGVKKVCPSCGGEGVQTTTVVKVRESPGDPAFLRVAKECITECSKLRGLYPNVRIGMVKSVVEEEGIGGPIRRSVMEMYATAPADSVIEALSALQGVRQRIKEAQQQRNLEGNSPIQTTAERRPAYDSDSGVPDTPNTGEEQ